MKKSRVTSMRALPPPTVNSVPEPQPPPSCMPRPNMAAPSSTETPTGAIAPANGWPKGLPRVSNGMNAKAATPIISICARMA
jgi:hypothetical protein